MRRRWIKLRELVTQGNPKTFWRAIEPYILIPIKNHLFIHFQRIRSTNADLILIPYNWLFDKSIRDHLSIDLTNAIIIIDEGHNISQVCEDLASIEITEEKLMLINIELKQLMIEIINSKQEDEKYKIRTSVKFTKRLQCIISSFSYYLKSIKFPVDNSHLELYDHMFEINKDFLVAKAKHLFTIINKASWIKDKSYDTKTDSEKTNKYKIVNEITEINLEFWTDLVENIIVDIAQSFKQNDKIHTEDFHKILKTLCLLRELREKLNDDNNDKLNGKYFWLVKLKYFKI